jgi:serine/threonine protein kinase
MSDYESDRESKRGALTRLRYDLNSGMLIQNYEIIKLIKSGGFCDIYEVKCIDDNRHYSMKIEPRKNKYNSLITEKRVYDLLAGMERFPAMKDFIQTDKCTVIICELLGANMRDIRKLNGVGIIHKNTSLRIALEMFRCIKDLHSKGVIHRDIKPQNFLIRPLKRYPVALIDFGLSFISKNERGCKVRKDGYNFAGTLQYTSPEVIKGGIPTERDDFYGWILTVIELMNGRLPWSDITNKNEMVEAMNEEDGTTFQGYIPNEIIEIFKLLKKKDANVDDIESLLNQSIEANMVEWNDPFVWEEASTEEVLMISPIQLRPLKYSEPIPHNKEQKPREFFFYMEPKGKSGGCCLMF